MSIEKSITLTLGGWPPTMQCSYEELAADISDYMRFYNQERPQRKFSGLTPLEYRMCA
jgi:hypothetical protein